MKQLWLVHSGFDYEFEGYEALFETENEAVAYKKALEASDPGAYMPELTVQAVPLFKGIPPSVVQYLTSASFNKEGEVEFKSVKTEIVWPHAYPEGEAPPEVRVTNLTDGGIFVFGTDRFKVAARLAAEIEKRKKK